MPPRTSSARVAALRLLAQRRLTESQLWSKLLLRGYAHEDVRGAVEACKRDRYLDDDLFARLFVEGKVKAVGDARLVGELVRRGVEREAAAAAVEKAPKDQNERLLDAIERLFRSRPALSYPSAARSLERLGFPTASIYRHLRERIRCAPEPSDR
ncbi:MAG: regulatory protein RecX [Vulcanimicrobiaceae bacterium]